MGVSRRETLEGSLKQFKKLGKSTENIQAELTPVKLDFGSERILCIFTDLSNTRGVGFSGPEPITYTEIQAYLQLTGETLTNWDVTCIREMDAAFLSETYEAQKVNQKTQKGKQ